MRPTGWGAPPPMARLAQWRRRASEVRTLRANRGRNDTAPPRMRRRWGMARLAPRRSRKCGHRGRAAAPAPRPPRQCARRPGRACERSSLRALGYRMRRPGARATLCAFNVAQQPQCAQTWRRRLAPAGPGLAARRWIGCGVGPRRRERVRNSDFQLLAVLVKSVWACVLSFGASLCLLGGRQAVKHTGLGSMQTFLESWWVSKTSKRRCFPMSCTSLLDPKGVQSPSGRQASENCMTRVRSFPHAIEKAAQQTHPRNIDRHVAGRSETTPVRDCRVFEP